MLLCTQGSDQILCSPPRFTSFLHQLVCLHRFWDRAKGGEHPRPSYFIYSSFTTAIPCAVLTKYSGALNSSAYSFAGSSVRLSKCSLSYGSAQRKKVSELLFAISIEQTSEPVSARLFCMDLHHLNIQCQRIFAAGDGVLGIDHRGPGHVAADACVGGVGVDDGFGAHVEFVVVHGVS